MLELKFPRLAIMIVHMLAPFGYFVGWGRRRERKKIIII